MYICVSICTHIFRICKTHTDTYMCVSLSMSFTSFYNCKPLTPTSDILLRISIRFMRKKLLIQPLFIFEK